MNVNTRDERDGERRHASGGGPGVRRIACTLLLLLPLSLTAQTTPPPVKPNVHALAGAVAWLGVTDLRTLRYSGAGTLTEAVGALDASPAAPLVTLKRYEAAIDYPGAAMQVGIVRLLDRVPAPGKNAAAVIDVEGHEIQAVSGSHAWDVAGDSGLPPSPQGLRQTGRTADSGVARANAAAAPERRQAIWTTPHGFLKAALANQPALRAAGSGTEVSFYSGRQRFVGFINSRNEVERVRTWVADPAGGDRLIDVTYTQYKPFGAIQFPTRITQRLGGPAVLDLTVDHVQANGIVRVTLPESLRASNEASDRPLR